MLVMTSHGVRQPVANILGLAQLFEKSIGSPNELMQLVDYMKQSALALDVFTKKLTVFMCNIGRDDNNRTLTLS
jgi:hypothetical protein